MTRKKPSASHKTIHNVPLKHRLIELFWTLGPAFTRWAESHMHQEGVSPQRVRLMSCLRDHGPMIMSDLCGALGVTATNITALVDALEKEEMVERCSHPTDRRAIVIKITPKAEEWLTKNCKIMKDRVSELFSGFSDQQQTQLIQLLEHMRAALIERDVLEESQHGCNATIKGSRT